MEEQILFKTKTGLAFPGLSLESHKALWQELQDFYGLTTAQLCEAASFSMAMVVRFALGLSALGGRVFCIADDSPAGWVAMGTLRHLLTAGAQGGVIVIPSLEKVGAEFELQITPIHKMGAEICTMSELMATGQASEFVSSCHNLLLGSFNRTTEVPSPGLAGFIDVLNEASTPIHAVESPAGVDVDTGKPCGSPIFASSTLSIGAPYVGLHAGSDYTGRHYLCDISIPGALYKKFGPDLSQLFAEQPVLQIFPVKKEELNPEGLSS